VAENVEKKGGKEQRWVDNQSRERRFLIIFREKKEEKAKKKKTKVRVG